MITIIAGKYKGRKLYQIDNHNVRPTQAKVRKSIFDILGPLDNKRVLDLYSGMGSLGIESLSRGAFHLTCVENNSSIASPVCSKAAFVNSMREVFFINVSTPNAPLNLAVPHVGRVWFGPAR